MQMELFGNNDEQSLLTLISKLQAQVADYQSRMTCSRKERKALREHGKNKVIDLLGSPKTDRYKLGYRNVFTDLWAAYKKHYELNSIDDTLEARYTEALHWINEWLPPTQLQQPAVCFLCGNNPGEIKADDVLICNDCSEFFF